MNTDLQSANANLLKENADLRRRLAISTNFSRDQSGLITKLAMAFDQLVSSPSTTQGSDFSMSALMDDLRTSKQNLMNLSETVIDQRQFMETQAYSISHLLRLNAELERQVSHSAQQNGSGEGRVGGW